MDSFSRLCSLNPLLAALGARVKVCRVVIITFAGFPMQMRNRTSLDTGDAAYFDFVFSPPNPVPGRSACFAKYGLTGL